MEFNSFFRVYTTDCEKAKSMFFIEKKQNKKSFIPVMVFEEENLDNIFCFFSIAYFSFAVFLFKLTQKASKLYYKHCLNRNGILIESIVKGFLA